MRVKFKVRKGEDRVRRGVGEGEGGVLRLCVGILGHFTTQHRAMLVCDAGLSS